MNTEKFLPIGTVCLLKNAKKRVMITGFAAKSQETGDRIFDYTGCLYPEGIISSNQNLLFDHGQIEKIFFLGFSDEEHRQFIMKIKQALNNLNNIQTINIRNNVNQQTVSNLNQNQFNQQSINDVKDIQMSQVQQNNVMNQYVNDSKRDDIFNSIPQQQ